MAITARTSPFSCVLLLTLVAGSVPAADVGANIDGLVRQWVALEQQRSRLESDWLVRSQHLAQQLQLLKLEEQTLRKFLANHSGTQDEVEAKRFELLEQQTALETRQKALSAWLDGLFTTLERLQSSLPPPLAAEWHGSIVVSRSSDDIGTSERLNHIVGMLQAAENFQRRIVVRTTTMSLADGAIVQVDQAFLGLSQGWYVSGDGQHAGYGRPGPDGWRWTDQAQIEGFDADEVRRLVSMVKAPATAELLQLPVRLGAVQ